MSTRRAASQLATRFRAVRDISALPSARYPEVFDRVGTRETRAQDDDRRASATGAGPLPRGFAASCATPALRDSRTRETPNACGWTLPSPPGAARARASSSSSARARSAPSSADATTDDDDAVRARRGGGRLFPDAKDDARPARVGPSSAVARAAFRWPGLRPFERLPEGAAAICVTSGVLMAGHACVAPVLPAFAAEFGASAAQIGACLSAFALARLVANAPSGAFADAKGRRPLLVAGPLITAVGMFGCASAGSLPELLLHRFVAGAGSAAYAGGASAALADLSTSANRGRVLGANQAATLAGAALGPALGGAIVAGTAIAQQTLPLQTRRVVSWLSSFFSSDGFETPPTVLGEAIATRAPFFAVGVSARAGPNAAAETPAAVFDRTETATGAVGARRAVGGGERSAATSSRRPRSARKDDAGKAERVRRARRDFFAASGVNAALFFSGSGGRATLVPLLAASAHGCDVAEIGALFSAMALTSLLGAAPAAALADAAPRRAVVSTAMALSSVSVLATAAAPTKELFAVAAVAWSASHALMGPAPAAYAADVAGPRSARGRALATYRTCGDVGMLLGPVTLGVAADAFGAASALSANGAALGAAAAAFRATASERDHRRAKEKG